MVFPRYSPQFVSIVYKYCIALMYLMILSKAIKKKNLFYFRKNTNGYLDFIRRAFRHFKGALLTQLGPERAIT